MLLGTRFLFLGLALHTSVVAADNPRSIDLGSGITAVKTLEQNWTDEESNTFYSVPQGSRLVPYDWFLNLEQANSTKLFREAEHMRALGYIPRTPDRNNRDGLPIGFIADASYEDGTRGLGITCAACHTSQIIHDGTSYIIDGGPAMGDFERLLKELAAALQATADDTAKFERFAAAVLSASATNSQKTGLQVAVRSIASERSNYNRRNLPRAAMDHFGPGRVDAFGAIFNEVSVTFLGVAENWHAANAPVSYPCLWDAPQHDRVQWNGAAENKVSPLGPALFRTNDVGALGRNSGEVLGVFGNAQINIHEFPLFPRRFESTVNRSNLIKIEKSLKALWSPEWPQDAFGELDSDLRTKGETLFKTHCSQCHAKIDRTAPDRIVVAKLSDEGTDPALNRNFGRMANTGRLNGRRKTLLGLDHFAETEPVSAILKHVVERVILDPQVEFPELRQIMAAAADNPVEALDSLNPGYRMTATIEFGNRKLVGRPDSLEPVSKPLKA